MNEEERIILKNIQRQVEENNDILKGMRSDSRRSKFFKFIYWSAIILIGLFAWSFIEPVITELVDTFDKVVEVKEEVSESVSDIKELIEPIKDATSGLSDLLDI